MTDLRFVTSYSRSAGSARVRVFDWIDHLALEANGSTYLDLPANSMGALGKRLPGVVGAELRLRREASRHDGTLLLSRQASPFSNGSIEERLLRNAQRGVYDFDDALMFSPLTRTERIWSKRRTWARAVASADVVIAGNAFLAEQAERLSREVAIVPSCVEPSEYVVKSHRDEDVPTAVWLGSPSTEQYLRTIAEPLLLAHRERGLRLIVISAGAAPLGDLDPMVTRLDWRSETYAENLLRGDFGIMPLDDDPWTRGKCAYKLLQYSAAGLPSVASPVGANATVLDRTEGIAAKDPTQWGEALVAMIDEGSDGRARRGAAARAAIERDYSFNAWAESWKQIVFGR
ncbi:glycosyltransferase family 4 protein [Leifsonia sp. NPDC102414]|uniref:glycosyltransferase family 4 protein n=1 Tax=Leifsonia sp. NPDC102414 TaxID=3364124 RepID=UPI0038276A4B